MSDLSNPVGFPELTELGKQLEVLRIGRGVSKQHLARGAGTSRQQLWRVMTGKSELTPALRERLAEVLRVDATALFGGPAMSSSMTTTTPVMTDAARVTTTFEESVGLADYVANVARLETTLRSLPGGDSGRALKRALLNAIEDEAVAHHVALAPAFFDVRRRVIAGEL